jgi:pimeloyl-ACP methyl ester carboxylesterase
LEIDPMISDCAFVRLNNGLRLAYVEQGSRDGIAVIMLHGYSDTHRSFDLVRPLLPRAWRVISVTQRGHGHSDKPHSDYAMDDFASDVPALLDALEIERAVIVGHSLGAAVALRAAAEYPERVAGLALIGGFADFRGNAGVVELCDLVGHFGDEIDPVFVRSFQASTIAAPMSQGFIEFVSNESLRCPTRAWKGVAQALMECDPLADAARVKAPSMLIWGDKDGFVPRADQHALRRALPAARLVTLSGAGHAPHWERTADTAACLRAFVSDIDEPRLYARASA